MFSPLGFRGEVSRTSRCRANESVQGRETFRSEVLHTSRPDSPPEVSKVSANGDVIGASSTGVESPNERGRTNNTWQKLAGRATERSRASAISPPHKARIVKTPLHFKCLLQVCAHYPPNPDRGMRYRGDPPLRSAAGSGALCPRDPVAYTICRHLPPHGFSRRTFGENRGNNVPRSF